jgi:hypothetical protein
MMSRSLTRTLLLAALAACFLPLLASAPGALAAPPPAAVATPTGSAKLTALQRIQRMVAKMNADAATPEGEARVVRTLSAQLRMPEETLRQQKQDWGVGYGEVAMIYGFARTGKPQVTAERVHEMRAGGMDWNAIAKELRVKIDAVATRMKRPPARGNAVVVR